MKFSESWIREWINPPVETKTLCHQLTMAGLEIDSVESIQEDTLVEVDLTPNRGDCLSIYGLAREVAVLNRLRMKPLHSETIKPTVSDTFPIEIDAPHDCPRYVGRVIKNIRPASTPSWLQQRLEQSDIRCIHPVVDVLNYVMLEMGQPMHAFDLAKLRGAIVVRHAKPDEALTLLDGQTVNLNANTLIIADKHQPLAIAGIMGGQDSGVNEKTTDLFLESALFTPRLIAGKARQYGLHTDSSFRFERGVDPTLQILAIERATGLICEICGGEPGKVLDVKNEKMIPKPQTITLRYDRISKLLGCTIPEAEVVTILTLLGCKVAPLHPTQNQSWEIMPPPFRYDISAEIDLIEELVRIVGYDKVPSRLPVSQMHFVPVPTQVPVARIKSALVDFGYQEVITYSFVDETLQKQLFPQSEMLALLNPISADMGVMRLSLWPGLLGVAKYNQHRQQPRQKLFEVGMRFVPSASGLIQEDMVAGLICGEQTLEHWNRVKGSFDFYDIKQPVESLWQLMGHTEPLTFRPTENPACHPGQVAQVLWQDKAFGVIGRLHPQLEKQLDLTGPVFLFELNMALFAQLPETCFEAPSRFPEIRRDLALIVDAALPSDSLTHFVSNAAGDILRDVKIFDVYTGKGIAVGRRSVGLGLIFQHPSRTLIDNEVDDLLHSIVTGLKKEFQADLRD